MDLKINEAKVDKIIHSLSLKYNIPKEEMKKIVNAQFDFAYQEIIKMDLKDLENLDNIKTNFLFKYIGKIYVDKNKVRTYDKRKFNERGSTKSD